MSSTTATNESQVARNIPETTIESNEVPSEEQSSDHNEDHIDDDDGQRLSIDVDRESEEGRDYQPSFKRPRFEALADEKQYDYELPDEMADYLNKYMDKYVPDKDLKDSIMTENPVPSNVNKPKKLDGYFKEILNENHKRNELKVDDALEKIQDKVVQVMGPLARVWYAVEATTTDSQPLSAEELSKAIEQSVLILGQAFNSVTYYRRLNVLSAIMPESKKAKTKLKDESKMLELSDVNLFGSKFQQKIIETAKAKKKSKEAYNISSKRPRAASSSASSSYRQPFRDGPSLGRRPTSGGRTSFTSSNQNNGQNRSNSFPRLGGKTKNLEKGNLGQQGPIEGRKLVDSAKISNNCAKSRFRARASSDSKVIYNKNTQLYLSRETKIFPTQLGKTHQRHRDFGHGVGFRNTIFGRTKTKFCTSSSKNEQRGVCFSKCGSGGHVDQGGHSESVSQGRRISEQHFSGPKERWRQQTSHKSEKSECIYTLSAFQNGESTFGQRNVAKRRLHVQNRSEGCLFFSPTKPKLQKICPFSVGGEPLRVPMSVLRLGSCSSHFHKVDENTDFHIEKTEHTGDNIPGRHIANEPDNKSTVNGQRYPDFSPSTLGVCDQLEKVSNGANPKNRIFGDGGRLSRNDSQSSSGKSVSVAGSLSKVFRQTEADSARTEQPYRKTVCNLTSSGCSPPSNQIFTKDINRCTKSWKELPALCDNGLTCRSGNSVVEKQSRFISGEVPTDPSGTSNNTDRRLQERMGCVLSRTGNQGSMVQGGEYDTYKCVRVESIAISMSNIHKDDETKTYSFSVGQYDSSSILCENGGDEKSRLVSPIKGNMGVFDVTGDHSYCRTPPRGTQCQSGLVVKKFPGLQRMAIEQTVVSSDMSTMGETGYRPVCIQTFSSDSSLHVLETRSRLSSSRCFSASMEKLLPLCFPPLFPGQQGTKQSQAGTNCNDTYHSSLANTTMVWSVTGNGCRQSSASTSDIRTFGGTTRSNSPPIAKPHSQLSGLENFRQVLASEGISEGAAELITNSRTKGTNSRYQSAWRKWLCWCEQREVDPYTCSLSYIINFLSYLYDEGLAYSTISSHRSAISAYHAPIDGFTVGKHPRVCALTSGVMNKRPPKPKLVFVWDVQQVLDYLDSFPVIHDLTDRDLILKLTMLLALCSASRGSEIQYLDTRYMARTHCSYIFKFGEITKTRRKGSCPPTAEFYEFSENRNLCVVYFLDHYLQRSKNWRMGTKFQLLLGTVKPHTQVVSSTIAGWVKLVLKGAGIDTSLFTAHSCRSASSSKAKAMGLSVSEILERGDWSPKSSTWQKFYCKPIRNKAKEYQDKVFGKK